MRTFITGTALLVCGAALFLLCLLANVSKNTAGWLAIPIIVCGGTVQITGMLMTRSRFNKSMLQRHRDHEAFLRQVAPLPPDEQIRLLMKEAGKHS